jgi:hypothetical protein
VDRHSRGSARYLLPLEAFAPVPGAPARSGPQNAGKDLLQIRRREPRGQPQAEHVHSPGVLQQKGGDQAHRHRDRRRAVGLRHGPCRQALRPRRHGLHGEGELFPETLPQDHDGDVGRNRARQPVNNDELRPEGPRAGPKQLGEPRHRHLRGGGGRRLPQRYELRPGLGPEPCLSAPDRDRT